MYLGAIPDPIESISGAIMVDSGRPTDINDIIIPDVDWLQ